MSITAREWEEAMEYLHSLEDLLEAVLEAQQNNIMWPDEVRRVLEHAKAMKHVWYNRDE